MRRALVTGASSGIGAAVARRLAERGDRVVLMARGLERLEAVRADLPGDGHMVVPCDVSDESALTAAMGKVREATGALDLVVCNAGVGYRAPIAELEVESIDTLLATNVRGPLLLARETFELLRAGDRPVFVHVASVVARRGVPGQAVYSASKAAVLSIAQAQRVEWAESGIAVSVLSPGLTSTGFFDAQDNPAGLEPPDLSSSDSAVAVADEILRLDRDPQPERDLRFKWRVLGALAPLAPRLADRLFVGRIGGDWKRPER